MLFRSAFTSLYPCFSEFLRVFFFFFIIYYIQPSWKYSLTHCAQPLARCTRLANPAEHVRPNTLPATGGLPLPQAPTLVNPRCTLPSHRPCTKPNCCSQPHQGWPSLLPLCYTIHLCPAFDLPNYPWSVTRNSSGMSLCPRVWLFALPWSKILSLFRVFCRMLLIQ